MQEIGSYDVSNSNFIIPVTGVPAGENSLKMTMTHWTGGALDLDLEVSYDGGVSWMYGGGAKGALSAEPGIEFHFTYQIPPTHVRGSFSSDQNVSSTLKFLAGR